MDDKGNIISTGTITSPTVGEAYSKSAQVISGYTFKQVKDDANKIIGATDTDVTYIYSKNPVAVTNVDDKGNTISTSTIISPTIGDLYSKNAQVIPGYTFKEVKDDANKVIAATDTDVTYVYTRNSILLHFQDKDGNTLSQDLSSTLDIGSLYSDIAPKIDGYTLSIVKIGTDEQASTDAKVKDTDQEVILVYTKDKPVITPTRILKIQRPIPFRKHQQARLMIQFQHVQKKKQSSQQLENQIQRPA